MKWIVLSRTCPARLHALLETGDRYLTNLRPHIVLPPSVDAHAFQLVSQRFDARWYAGDFRETIVGLVSQTDASGKQDQHVLLTADGLLCTGEADMWSAQEVLRCDNAIRCVILTPAVGACELSYYTKATAWTTHQSPPSFHYGAVYRASDLLTALERNQWDSISTLHSALQQDPTLARRDRLAYSHKSCMATIWVAPTDSVYRYNQGETLDVTRLLEGTVQWNQPEE